MASVHSSKKTAQREHASAPSQTTDTDVVTLKAMRFHARIGVLPHEAEIAQSIAQLHDPNGPERLSVVPTVFRSGALSGLGRPQEICCSASRSGSAYANSPSSSCRAVRSAASSWSVNSIGGRWKFSGRSE